ncbi:E3 ubiquitin-protein ligase RNF128-like, partial [Limulus polyphemus]|uniref:E3 ubiquitin-protein ligase RNF128-like n=1 Tax=Limulus polyphemus TaxID=6850 RepID=A0ABM1S3Q2_LIMPO
RRLYIAAKKALDKIPVKTLKLSDREAEGEFECCAVCIEMFKLGEVVRTLPCKHTFHKSCVDPWLLDQRSCPMCKMDILKYYGLVITDSQESVLNNDDMDFPNMHHGEDLGIIHVPVHQHPAPNQSCSPERREVRSASHSASSNRADCSLFIPIQSSTQPLGQSCSTSSPDLPSPSIWGFKSEDELFLCPELEAGYQEQSDSSNSSQDPLMVTQDKEVRENPEVN